MRRRQPVPKKVRTRGTASLRTVGLARAISKLGYCSRSQAAELIVAGRVRLNGRVPRDPETPVRLGPGKTPDRIEVDGSQIRPAKKTYWMLNKPRGTVTTASDEQGRETVYDSLRHGPGWLAPVGRLDKASEGLLLFTNDSEWAARMLDPSGHVPKTYHVQVAGLMNEPLLQALRTGVHQGADFLRAEQVLELRRGERNSWLQIVLREGKNRQIRRMLDSVGLEVLRLVRVAIGSLKLGDLPKGQARELSAAEKAEAESRTPPRSTPDLHWPRPERTAPDSDETL